MAELPEREADQINLRRVLDLRAHRERLYFNQVAGRFGRSYGPGRSWQAFGQLLLRILPPLTVADLGSGEGLLSELLALRCRRVIAVDNSGTHRRLRARPAPGRPACATSSSAWATSRTRPSRTPAMDLVLLSQALHHAEDPARALHSAWRILKPGGQVWILDLLQHNFERARELYGDRWLGFTEGQLQRWLEEAGFRNVEVCVVAREETPPHFQTVLAGGTKPEQGRGRSRTRKP
ncbi:MAG: hypothetical protein KatS3mg132_670 [Limisphaera sp.]|nr:MAG: hypothetical protein KatS3mg132_670 [Limisphaera sp.]